MQQVDIDNSLINIENLETYLLDRCLTGSFVIVQIFFR